MRLVVINLFIFFSCALFAEDVVSIGNAKVVPGEYMVKTKNNLQCGRITKIYKYKVVSQRAISNRENASLENNVCVVMFKKDPGLKILKNAILKDIRFEYIEPNFIKNIAE